jgi:hypothetical protein
MTVVFRGVCSDPVDAACRASENTCVGGTGRVAMKNGLNSIHASLMDGRVGKGSGVVVFRDGKIVGGDAHTTPVLRHTSSKNPVGIGVSDTLTDKNAIMKGTALVGSSSQLFDATLRKLISGQRHCDRHRQPDPRHTPYSAASSSGAMRGRIILIRVPPPGSEFRSSRPPRRLVTML